MKMAFSTPNMTFAAQVAERSVRAARERAEAEVRVFVEAGLRALRRTGAQRLTVAEVLAEAHRSTRAFYRHFASKDELLLAIYDHESRATITDLRRQVEAAPTARAGLEAWVDATLALAFDPARARRTRVLASEGSRLQVEHPAEFGAIAGAQLRPLVETLERGRADGTFPAAEPEADARTVHAIVWAFVEAELRGTGTATVDEARAQVLRFGLAGLGCGGV
jgi:AcrR family transcriptional regulator